jgi:hypothetical protein
MKMKEAVITYKRSDNVFAMFAYYHLHKVCLTDSATYKSEGETGRGRKKQIRGFYNDHMQEHKVRMRPRAGLLNRLTRWSLIGKLCLGPSRIATAADSQYKK